MNNSVLIKKTLLLLIVFILALFLFSCSGLKKIYIKSDNFDLKESESLMQALKGENSDLKTFKGTGKIKLYKNGSMQSARVVWAGTNHGKLRMEVLSITGQPAISIASDGKWLYLILHAENRYYKKKNSDAGLKKIISIPVKLDDMLLFLSGRVPIYRHSIIMVDKKEDSSVVIVLKKKWRGLVEKIYMYQNKTDGYKVELFNGTGNFLYRVRMENMKKIGNYLIPEKIEISNDDALFQLVIDKSWVDCHILSSIFVLNPPNIE